MTKYTKEEIKKRNYEDYIDPYGRARFMHHQVRKNARNRGIYFDLTIQDFIEGVTRGKCQKTGIDFDFRGKRTPFIPSVDRVDNSKGYTKENCLFVIWGYNAAKGTGTHDDVKKIAKAIIANS